MEKASTGIEKQKLNHLFNRIMGKGISKEHHSKMMSALADKGTKPELVLEKYYSQWAIGIVSMPSGFPVNLILSSDLRGNICTWMFLAPT